jgi:hypothetical protein
MGRFNYRYTDEQRAAIVRAINEEGLEAQHAVELAAKGQLHDRLPAFEMSASTARSLATNARQRHTRRRAVELERQKPGAVEEIVEEALRMVLDELRDEDRRRRDNGEADYVRLRRILRTARELQALLRAIPPAPPTNGSPHGADETDDLKRAMLRDIEREQAEEREQDQPEVRPATDPGNTRDFWFSPEVDAEIRATAERYGVTYDEVDARLQGSIPGTLEHTPRQAINRAAELAAEARTS